MTRRNQMRRYAICLCLFAIWASGVSVTEAQERTGKATLLKIGTMDLPPYGWQDSKLEKHGIIYELNQEIGTRTGFMFTNEILPHYRMYDLLKSGKLDLISSQAHEAAEDAGDRLAVQFNINIVAATQKGSGIQKIEDLRGKRLIYHYSASYPQLDGLPEDIHRVKGYRQMLRMLHSRPYDGAVFSEPAYYYWMQDLGFTPDDFGNVIVIEGNKKHWTYVRKGLPQKIRSVLKRVVEEIYQEDRYRELLIKYGKPKIGKKKL